METLVKSLHRIDAKLLPNKYYLKDAYDEINGIDVCPLDGNLLAACSISKKIDILDRRESKIVKRFDQIHESKQKFLKC